MMSINEAEVGEGILDPAHDLIRGISTTSINQHVDQDHKYLD